LCSNAAESALRSVPRIKRRVAPILRLTVAILFLQKKP
jgi:hypothetical protein